MKLFKGLVCSLVLLLGTTQAFSASETTQRYSCYGGFCVLTLDIVFDSAAGTYNTFTTQDIVGFVREIMTDPGTVAPTAAYDITLTYKGVEIFGTTALDDRSATATERVSAYDTLASETGPIGVDGPLVLAIANQDVHSAELQIKIWVITPR